MAHPPPPQPPELLRFRVQRQAEEFLYQEADLLDQRRYAEWLGLLADDLVYFMPMRRNVRFGEHAAHENTRLGQDISWFEEDKWTLSKRVEQIMTGIHWAEEPLSRVCHMVSNVRLLEVRPSEEQPEEVLVSSRFLVYQNRVQTETNLFVGKRQDLLRQTQGAWKLARREILLDQNVLQAKNLTVFF
ncbi:MAG TPA: 3-phenylpropionate/cinnamic acid dioxygenase subunit beta [bacterium]|nr:3-phenylpropionate/cinnamic acid dioxygenase subunit beta [bacterium]